MNQKLSISTTDWLQAPYNVRLFILRYLCETNACGATIHLGHLIALLRKYSNNYFPDFSFGDSQSTHRDHIIHVDDLVIGWDGEEMIDQAWYHTVNSIKKQLATPFLHEMI